jgi:hypothetical protein
LFGFGAIIDKLKARLDTPNFNLWLPFMTG